MATINLFIKNKDVKQTSITAIIRDGGKRIILSTGIKIPPKHWSAKNQKVLGVNPDAIQYNRIITEFKSKAFSIYQDAKLKGLIVNGEYMREMMTPKEKAVSKVNTFWDAYDNYLEYISNKNADKTIKKFNTLKNKHLKGFEETKKVSFDLDNIGVTFFNSFQSFLESHQKLRVDSVGKYLKNFKTFLNWCVLMNITENEEYKKFKVKHQPQTLRPILTKAEIEKLSNTSFDADYLNNAKDLLVLSCLTGLRFSDYSKINKAHIRTDQNGKRYITIRQTKTNEPIEVPLNKTSNRIVDDLLEGVKVRVISNQKLNKYIKEVCKLAEIDELFEVHEFRGKFKTSKKVHKYELIETHTGRRSFASNLLIDGLNSEIVMKFTGHTDYKSFMRYVNVPKTEEMDLVRRALGG
ncbi:site-specific integrase [Flammeovirga aprica]|uniref:Site-specific integrase n=1 Tax=Flammeovirga aprica JL-4 TaxID=694437 RepID=A0A7X9NZD8_9BACT|nr:site-specific integrase [Flammeovirga aprica]NME66595.1 site-specific integrase [Flammeovirga aprica JL-4]